jgi:hypothetical protein
MKYCHGVEQQQEEHNKQTITLEASVSTPITLELEDGNNKE